MAQRVSFTEFLSCGECPVGSVSGCAKGSRCPLVDRRRPAGTLLYVVGEPVETVWFIKYGAVMLSRAADDRRGEGTPWAVRRRGSFLGLEGLVRPTYLDSARALTDVTLCGAPRTDVLQWLGSTDGGARVLLEGMLLAQSADTPRRTNADGSALERVAAWLCESSADNSVLTLPRRVVAGLLGMQPETLSRCLAALSDQGALRVTRRSIEVTSRDKLESIATGA
ncbi:MAG: Crp/Fnr family transcriptional regulator [Myxococcales bacterium]|nr:Crp/Fnr family transcriptional regulator [Myxococcales bacterium]